jgi:5-methylcytosine-specific restriction enzyme A
MPMRMNKICQAPHCCNLTDGAFCEEHKPKRIDKRESASKRGYDSRWRKARKTYLSNHPLCCYCEKEGVVKLAEVVDHIIPHRGDSGLFWDSKNNWQPLCKRHHDVKTASEDGGFNNKIINKN